MSSHSGLFVGLEEAHAQVLGGIDLAAVDVVTLAFEGRGYQARFVHDRYPLRACAIALEFKKFYMDEWTGEPNAEELSAMRRFISNW